MASSARALAKAGKRWLHLGHRWLGIATGLFFAMWFASGAVMMYVAYPTLTEPERRAGLPAIAWDAVRVEPDAALAGEARFPRGLSLSMRGAEPVYRVVGWDGARRAVSAVDGRPIGPATPDEALAVAGHDPRSRHPAFRKTIAYDLWTVHQRYDAARPLHRIALGDPEGTELYVSEPTGAVVLDTTRHERFWNWFGAVPHWLYVTPLRAKADLWRMVILWMSGIAVVSGLTGFALGLVRLRLARRYPSGAATPYRGLARWHHVGGLVGGLALLSFVVSGWLSMNPNRWFSSSAPTQAMLERYADAPGARTGLDLASIRGQACAEAAEVRFTWLGGAPLAPIACRDGREVPCCGTPTVAPGRVAAAARRLVPEAGSMEAIRLDREDFYWTSHHRRRRLPVLRVTFDDPAATWFHIDPATGEILSRLDRSGRAERWGFELLHTFDLGLLVRHRPAWDGFMLLLLAAGSVVAASGVAMGWRRLRRPAAGSRPA
ncbi:PepSY domain-containing protein [Methylobacterium sp. WL120]|uniref:PepSY domain-containing protein n=1 Tax=Methylobacterium sp. WL120 TaxID=2603887 RepID=UPI0011C79DA5|nr:PepSY domain-containing protein [Methylobacterium sp. WL120]TXM66414.1 PepSY domain-containing protein [Methylobacterium sp. WL120]